MLVIDACHRTGQTSSAARIGRTFQHATLAQVVAKTKKKDFGERRGRKLALDSSWMHSGADALGFASRLTMGVTYFD
jgi:hypothetical protein